MVSKLRSGYGYGLRLFTPLQINGTFVLLLPDGIQFLLIDIFCICNFIARSHRAITLASFSNLF